VIAVVTEGVADRVVALLMGHDAHLVEDATDHLGAYFVAWEGVGRFGNLFYLPAQGAFAMW
jgi:hypothetical protein